MGDRRLHQPSLLKDLCFSLYPDRRTDKVSSISFRNFQALLAGNVPNVSYDGYSCCPIFVGGNKAILAEYKYNDIPDMTFIRTQQKPSRLVFIIVRDFFPVAYWKFVPQGVWLGKDGIRSW